MFCRIAFLIAAVFGSGTLAQSPGPTPRPDGRANTQIRALEDENSRFDPLRSIEKLSPKAPPKFHPLLDRKTGIYRKAGEVESRVLAVDESHLSAYSLFLKQPGTGIFKLSGDSSCISDGDLVVAREQCVT